MRPHAAFFDCDGVLTTDDIFPWINDRVGKKGDGSTIQVFWNKYYDGIITIGEYAKILFNFYRRNNFTRKILENILKYLPINSEAIKIVQYLKEKTIPVAIVSTGWLQYVKKCANILGINSYTCGFEYIFDPKGNFIGIKRFSDDPIHELKINFIRKICRETNIELEETFYVGDSRNDIPPFQLTKHGILYKTNDSDIEKHAWKKINNLNEIKAFI